MDGRRKGTFRSWTGSRAVGVANRPRRVYTTGNWRLVGSRASPLVGDGERGALSFRRATWGGGGRMGLQVLQAGSTLRGHKPLHALGVETAGDQERGGEREGGAAPLAPQELGWRSGWALGQWVLSQPRASNERTQATHRGTRYSAACKGQRMMTTEKIT